MDQTKRIPKFANEVKKHFEDCYAMPIFTKNLRDEPLQVYEDFLAGDSRRAILATTADELHTWHLSRYAHALYSQRRYAWEELALAARYAHAHIKFQEAFDSAGRDGMVLPWAAALAFSLNVLCGWRAESGSIGQALYRGLDTSVLGLRHNPEHSAGTLFRHFWFVMHLYCDMRDLKLDTSLYSYPEDMSPYAEVLANWRTSDENKLQSFVGGMCDFHLLHARTGKHGDVLEFDTEDRMLFPYEILCWLRFREWSGIANPPSFDHPLMHQPMAAMPGPDPLPQPDTPLLDAVVAKFKAEFPGSFEG